MLYNLAKAICSVIIHLLFRIHVDGIHNFPEEGPVIIFSNHRSMWDPVIIGCVLKRPVYFMAKQELFKIPVFGFVLRNINAFPVRRDNADRKAIKRGLEILSSGKVLGIFPEGTRSKTGELLKPEPGIALMAVRSKNAALVPIAIKGSYRWFSDIYVKIGKPTGVKVNDERLSSQKLCEISERLFVEISKLMAS
ncbi:lysophospholipid acyltransferase family protein [Thermoanaerobacterium sp. DL9XJH110]|uniref:lysophospholipid acyltransferase family protein n=1 Tax=Thermoanaerobacterium sp. DL9XJH110 TaxID=3386643 RepID=UPI003BB7B417